MRKVLGCAGAGVAVVGFMMLVAWGGISCLLGGMVEFKEMARSTSPDGAFDAVYVRSNGGATTSFGCHVPVVPHGGGADRNRTVFIADKCHEGVEMTWKGQTLNVGFPGSARVFRKDPAIVIDGARIEITYH